MFVDRNEYQSTNTIACPLPMCNNVWCKNCQQITEVGGPQHSCDGSTELQDLMVRRGWRHCPGTKTQVHIIPTFRLRLMHSAKGCRTPIQKDAGCNHMTVSYRVLPLFEFIQQRPILTVSISWMQYASLFDCYSPIYER